MWIHFRRSSRKWESHASSLTEACSCVPRRALAGGDNGSGASCPLARPSLHARPATWHGESWDDFFLLESAIPHSGSVLFAFSVHTDMPAACIEQPPAQCRFGTVIASHFIGDARCAGTD